MTSITTTVCDATSTLSRVVPQHVAEVLLATLSADPDTLGEMGSAAGRFFRRPALSADLWDGWQACDLAGKACRDRVLIDLPGRLVIWEGESGPLGHQGSVRAMDDPEDTEPWIDFDVADHWELVDRASDWSLLIAQRREARRQQPGVDIADITRNGLVEFLVDQCRRPYQESEFERARMIHQTWLSTADPQLPRPTRRLFLLDDHDHLASDLEDRTAQWQRSGQCPQGLSTRSWSYRHSGFGPHEWIMYYELVRHLALAGLNEARRQERITESHLHRVLSNARDQWLRTPIDGPEDFCPAEVIDHERRRIPLSTLAADSVVDDDCPLCQMLAESTGPCFVHFDQSNIDDDFIFSTYTSREQWTAECGFEATDLTDDEADEDEDDDDLDLPGGGTWSTLLASAQLSSGRYVEAPFTVTGDSPAMVISESDGDELTVRLFRLAGKLAEVIESLKPRPQSRSTIDALNGTFADLRWALRREPDRLPSVIDQLCHRLRTAADRWPDLQPAREEVQRHLATLTDGTDEPPCDE